RPGDASEYAPTTSSLTVTSTIRVVPEWQATSSGRSRSARLIGAFAPAPPDTVKRPLQNAAARAVRAHVPARRRPAPDAPGPASWRHCDIRWAPQQRVQRTARSEERRVGK